MPGSKQAGQANLLQGFVSSTNPQHQRSDEYRLDPNVDLNLGLDEPKRPWRKVGYSALFKMLLSVLI